MAIGADKRIANGAHVQHLPPHWGTLYELTKLTDQQFEAKLASGLIHPELERRDVVMSGIRERRAAREAGLGARQLALPDKRYGVIYGDCPWRWEAWSRETGLDCAGEAHYLTMFRDALKALDVQSIAADDCAQFMWATVPALDQSLEVMKAWGFTYKSHFVWVKTYAEGSLHLGTGYWNRNAHELLLVGTRGDIPAPAPGEQWPSVIHAPVGRHSEKPAIFYELIESYFPNLPKIELFARQARPGWDCWGAEAPIASEAAE
jgi:N6-adenosine-specific RNA methylase IME4